MGTKKSNLPIKEWEDSLKKMSYEEIQEYISIQGICYPKFLELAKVKLEEQRNNVVNVFLKVLKRRHCKYEMGKYDNEFLVTYNRKKFCVKLSLEDDSAFIYYIHDIYINKENEAKISCLMKAVNQTNKICHVNTVYLTDEDTDVVSVASKTSLRLITQNSNFETELMMTLIDCLTARDIVKKLMKRKYNKRMKVDKD